MDAVRKAFLDLRVTILAEIARRNASRPGPAALRDGADLQTEKRLPAGRRGGIGRLWKRLRRRRAKKRRQSAIWPTPEHLVKRDSPSGVGADDGKSR